MDNKELYKDTVFAPYKDHMLYDLDIVESYRVLQNFMNGQDNTKSAIKAIRHLEYIYGTKIKHITRRLTQVLFCEDPDTIEIVFKKGLAEIHNRIF